VAAIRSSGLIDRWRVRVAELRAETFALYLACRDPRVPWLPKLLAGVILAYLLSPIDLVPDFIPVLGYVDELVLVPIGLALVRRLIPHAILAEHRGEAARRLSERPPRSRLGAAIVMVVWLAVCVWIGSVVWRSLDGKP